MSMSIKKLFINKKVVAIAAAGALSLGVAGAAYAYFTSTGSGTGSAATGSQTALTIQQTNTVSGLLPGGSAGTVNLKIVNTSGGAENLGVVSVVTDPTASPTSSVTSGSLTSEACVLTMYNFGSSAPVGTLAPGGIWTGSLTVSMSNDGSNQDNCQAPNGGALTLQFSAAQGA